MAQALVQVGSTITLPGGSSTTSLWVLPAFIANGTGTLTVTTGSSLGVMALPAIFSGVIQSSTPDSAGSPTSVSSSTTNLSLSTTTVASSSLAIAFDNASRGDDLAGANTVRAGAISTSTGGVGIFYGSTAKTPAGSTTLTLTNSASRSVIGQAFSFADAGSIAFDSIFTGDVQTTGTTHTYSFNPNSVANSLMVVNVFSTGAAPTGVTWAGVMPYFGSTFGQFTFNATNIIISFINILFGSTFNQFTPTVTNSESNWTRIQKSVDSWATQLKSLL